MQIDANRPGPFPGPSGAGLGRETTQNRQPRPPPCKNKKTKEHDCIGGRVLPLILQQPVLARRWRTGERARAARSVRRSWVGAGRCPKVFGSFRPNGSGSRNLPSLKNGNGNYNFHVVFGRYPAEWPGTYLDSEQETKIYMLVFRGFRPICG